MYLMKNEQISDDKNGFQNLQKVFINLGVRVAQYLAFAPPTIMTWVWLLPGAYVGWVIVQSQPDSEGFSPGIPV